MKSVVSFIGLCGVAFCAAAQSHPLDERLWDTRRGQFVSLDAVQGEAAQARYVLLGEKHDSALHHARQLQMLQALAQRGVRPSLAMEQFDNLHQAALSSAQEMSADAEALADAGQLNRKGWRWPMYKDLIAFAAARGWPLRAANLSRGEGRDIAMAKLTPELPAADAAQQAAMEAEIVRGHCGQRPEPARLAAIVLAQRARDVRMAQALDNSPQPVAFIAGAGHVRRDTAVPRYLAQPERALAIGMIEIEPGKAQPADYELAGFDVVWFTAATERPDPCAQPLTGAVSVSVATPTPSTTPKETP